MNARIIKESRALLPTFCLTLLASILPALIWPQEEIGMVLFAGCCALMAASSFGQEFQGRTMPLLLAQPVSRRTIWREKMQVLGAAMTLGFAALLLCSRLPNPTLPALLALTAIPLCIFCATPWLTLVTRHTLMGTVTSFGLPMSIGAILAFFVWMFSLEALLERNIYLSIAYLAIPGVIYCAVSYRFGYDQFLKLEAVDSQAQQISLPSRLESLLARPLNKLIPGYTGTIASLVKKELRLQQISFLAAGFFCVVALAGALLYPFHIVVGDIDNLAVPILGADFAIYMLLIPFIAGAICIGEEKAWGVADWHLTLPPSAVRQWSTKMLVALSTSLALGLLLPTALGTAGAGVLGIGQDRSTPPMDVLLGFVLGHLLLTSIVIYAASLSRNTVGAIILALGLILVGGCLIRFGILIGSEIPDFTILVSSEHQLFSAVLVALFALTCLLQRFAFVCYRQRGVTIGQRIIQAVVLATIVTFAGVISAALNPLIT